MNTRVFIILKLTGKSASAEGAGSLPNATMGQIDNYFTDDNEPFRARPLLLRITAAVNQDDGSRVAPTPPVHHEAGGGTHYKIIYFTIY